MLFFCYGSKELRAEKLDVQKAGQTDDKKYKDDKKNRFSPAAIINYIHNGLRLIVPLILG
jgi:hypothetical protein